MYRCVGRLAGLGSGSELVRFCSGATTKRALRFVSAKHKELIAKEEKLLIRKKAGFCQIARMVTIKVHDRRRGCFDAKMMSPEMWDGSKTHRSSSQWAEYCQVVFRGRRDRLQFVIGRIVLVPKNEWFAVIVCIVNHGIWQTSCLIWETKRRGLKPDGMNPMSR